MSTLVDLLTEKTGLLLYKHLKDHKLGYKNLTSVDSV